jgi:hypothetical protein
MLKFEKKWPHYAEGAYGAVFFSADGRATKVFKRRNDDTQSHTRNVFESEVAAYKIAVENNDLVKLVPKFYGCVSVTQILDSTGQDISNEYELDYAYQMERVNGDFQKHGCYSTPVGELFYSVGIKHLSDTSLIYDDHENIICVIDFALKEHILEHKNF